MTTRLSFIVAALSLCATSVHAAPSSFNLIEVGFGESDPYNLVLEGYELTASMAATERFFVAGTFGNFSSEVQGSDVDTEVMSVRAGFMDQETDRITLYAGPEVVRSEYTFMDETYSDSGYGGFAGIHNQVTDSFSFNMEALVTRLFDETSFAVEATARYYVTPRFSLVAAGSVGGYSGYSLRAAYHY